MGYCCLWTLETWANSCTPLSKPSKSASNFSTKPKQMVECSTHQARLPTPFQFILPYSQLTPPHKFFICWAKNINKSAIFLSYWANCGLSIHHTYLFLMIQVLAVHVPLLLGGYTIRERHYSGGCNAATNTIEWKASNSQTPEVKLKNTPNNCGILCTIQKHNYTSLCTV